MAMGACQWSGVAMVMASISLSSRSLRKSFSVAGDSPIALRRRRQTFQDVGVHVADMRDARGLFIGLQRGEMRVGAAVEADDGEVEPIVGA